MQRLIQCPLRGVRPAFACAALAGAAGVTAHAQIASAMLQEGGPLPGVPGVNVSSINNSAVNHVGGFAFQINTSDSLARVWGNASGGAGATMRVEGTFGALVQTGFESFYGISDAGRVSYSPSGTGGPVGGFDSVWLDDDPIALERLQQSLIDGLKAFEFALRRQVEGADKGRPVLGGTGDVPAQFRSMVDEYYRSLSKKPQAKSP